LSYREVDVTITARRRKPRSPAKPPPRVLSVYAGRERLGGIIETDECRAFGPTGKKLGTFETRALALAAIDALPTAPEVAPRPRRARNAKAAVLSGRANG
jgi:hypothetical protein